MTGPVMRIPDRGLSAIGFGSPWQGGSALARTSHGVGAQRLRVSCDEAFRPAADPYVRHPWHRRYGGGYLAQFIGR
jgi:hypothetical protein